MTDQEIFNKVLAHLREQGRPAELEPGSCAYRAADGATCAVGCLIPDHAYDPCIEGSTLVELAFRAGGGVPDEALTANSVLLDEVLARSGIAWRQYPLLRELQIAHDLCLSGEMDAEGHLVWGRFDPALRIPNWEARMLTVAAKHGLVYTAP